MPVRGRYHGLPSPRTGFYSSNLGGQIVPPRQVFILTAAGSLKKSRRAFKKSIDFYSFSNSAVKNRVSGFLLTPRKALYFKGLLHFWCFVKNRPKWPCIPKRLHPPIPKRLHPYSQKIASLFPKDCIPPKTFWGRIRASVTAVSAGFHPVVSRS